MFKKIKFIIEYYCLKLSYFNKFPKRSICKTNRNPQIIVSLTSMPERMKDLHIGLYSLFNQTATPDRIILWLSKEEFPNKEKDLPKKILKFKKFGLEIKWCDNIKSYKKLIPTLQKFPDDVIITADDDILYPEEWLLKLLSAHEKEPNTIFCHRAHRIIFDDNKNILPYNAWEHCVKTNKGIIFPTVGGGALYPPGSLFKDTTQTGIFTELAPNADDIWFWAMATLQKTPVRLCPDNIDKLTYTNPLQEYGIIKSKTLFQSNGNGGNDRQLNAVLKNYPELKNILLSASRN